MHFRSSSNSRLQLLLLLAASNLTTNIAFIPSLGIPKKPFLLAPKTKTKQTTSHSSTTRIYQITPDGRADMDIVFGSEYESDQSSRPQKTEYGLYEDDVDEDQRDRQTRRETVEALMREQDEEFRQERKLRQWGKFANITNKKDLEPLLAEEQAKIDLGMFWDCSIRLMYFHDSKHLTYYYPYLSILFV